jgi:hypothetical protein
LRWLGSLFKIPTALTGVYPLAKTKLSSTDLIWVFREKLSLFDDCSPSIPIAIVPGDAGWTRASRAY